MRQVEVAAHQRERAAQLHGGGAAVEPQRLQRAQRCIDLPALRRPAATAAHAACRLLRRAQLGAEGLHYQRARIVGSRARIERQLAQWQLARVPGAGVCIAQFDHRRGRLVDAAAAEHRLAAERGGGQGDGEGRQVQALRAGPQVGQRPCRERAQRGLCIERLFALRYRGRCCRRDGRAQRGLCRRLRQRAGQLGAGGPRERVGGAVFQAVLRELQARLQRQAAAGFNAPRGFGAQPIPGQAEPVDAVQRAGLGTQMQAGLHLAQRLVAQRGGVQFSHAQRVHLQLERQAQIGGRIWRRGLGVGAGLEVHARRMQLVDDDAKAQAVAHDARDVHTAPADRREHHAVAVARQLEDQLLGIEIAE